MAKNLFTKLLALLAVAALLFLVALFLIPNQVQSIWQAWNLPETPLQQMQTRLGLMEPASKEIRLYGTLEARTIHAMSELEGRAIEVLIDEGDWVEQGALLIRLEPTDIQAQVIAAEEALKAAEAAREAAAAPPSPETKALAESNVAKARIDLDNAQRTLSHAQKVLANPLTLEAQINQTAALIPVAQAQVDAARASVRQMEVLIADAQGDGSRQGQYRLQILKEQKAAAEASLEAAQARVEGLRQTLALLKEMRANPLNLQAQVHQAEMAVAVAEAALQVAEAERDAQIAPPQPEAVAVAEARVQQAKAALDLVLWKQDRLTIVAPASGRVQAKLIAEGETVMPGKALITLADTRQLEVWVYVASQDLHRIHVGDTLPVEVIALPDETFEAQVFYIAPEAQFRPTNVLNPDDRGDMVFLVKLLLDNEDGRLKPGMPADVLLPK